MLNSLISSATKAATSEVVKSALAHRGDPAKPEAGIYVKTPRASYFKPGTKPFASHPGIKVGAINDGGITLTGEEIMNYSGNDPRVDANLYDFDPTTNDWVCVNGYDSKRPNMGSAIHAHMLRPFSSKGQHIARKNCITWPHGTTWNGTAVTAKNMDTHLDAHRWRQMFLVALIEKGLVNQFKLEHPTTYEIYNIVVKPFEFTVEEATSAYESKYTDPDANDTFNRDVSRELLLNAISPNLVARATSNIPFHSPGPIVFMNLMYQCVNHSWEHIQRRTNDISKLSLSNYAGENVTKLSDDIRLLLTELSCFNPIEPSVLRRVLRAYESGSDYRFRLFAVGHARTLEPDLQKLRFRPSQRISVKDFLDCDSAGKLDFLQLTQVYNQEYLALVDSSLYTPLHKSPRANLAAETAKEIKDLKASVRALTLAQKKKPSPKKDKNQKPLTNRFSDLNTTIDIFKYCWRCGCLKHGRCTEDDSWKKTKVGDTIKHNQMEFDYCTVCNLYCTHSTKHHDEWVKARDARLKRRASRGGGGRGRGRGGRGRGGRGFLARTDSNPDALAEVADDALRTDSLSEDNIFDSFIRPLRE